MDMKETQTPIDKKCITCKQTRLLHFFDQDKHSKDLRKNECIGCTKKEHHILLEDKEIQWLTEHLVEQRSECRDWLDEEKDEEVIFRMRNRLEIIEALLQVLEAGTRLRR